MYKPIIFSIDMVRAILENRKNVTRRVINPQPSGNKCHGICTSSTDKKDIGEMGFGDDCLINSHAKPRYQSGDILWLRETWNEYFDGYVYKADTQKYPRRETWKPSIHMPRKAARIFLRVTDVRVERVQDISYDRGDIWAEGIPARHDRNAEINSFIELWDSINAKRGYSWADNPFVWVISFEHAEKPEGWPSVDGGKV